MKHIKGQINRNARFKIPTNINEMKVYENNITRLNSFSRKKTTGLRGLSILEKYIKQCLKNT